MEFSYWKKHTLPGHHGTVTRLNVLVHLFRNTVTYYGSHIGDVI